MEANVLHFNNCLEVNTMYEIYTRQALPERNYRELLGSAICVFNANNAFIIENVLRTNGPDTYNWYSLIDLESGKMKQIIKETITGKLGRKIEELFSRIIVKRNRIIHSFQITHNGKQMLATKEKEVNGGRQFLISEDYLLGFIDDNEILSTMLHEYRGF